MDSARWCTKRSTAKTHGDKLAAVGKMLGFDLYEWQQYVGDVALEIENGVYKYRTVGCTVGRQNGKSALSQIRVALELLKPNHRIAYTAQDRNMARSKWEEICDSLTQSSTFAKRVKRQSRANGQEKLVMNNGAVFQIVTPSSKGSRGLSLDLAIIDEALVHSLTLVSALQPTLAARPSPQLWILSSAGGPQSTMLAHYRQLGHEQNPSLAWFEWCPHNDNFDMYDPDVWRQAIPTLEEKGRGVSLEAVQDASQTTDPATFCREWLNVWEALEKSRVVDVDRWLELTRPDILIGDQLCFGLDIAPTRDNATISAAGQNGAWTPVEVIDARPRTGWVKDRVVELYEKWGAPIVIDSGSAASSLITELEQAGVDVQPINMRQYAQSCGQFFDGIETGAIVHNGDKRLELAVEHATRRKLGEQWAWGRGTGNTDITPLVSCTLARYGLIARLSGTIPKPAVH